MINMHLHTKASDGILSPEKLVKNCMSLGLDLISITDHDTFEAYKSIPESTIPLRIMPGIEISSFYKNDDVHVLGYGCDIHDKELVRLASMYLENRRDRALKMIELLREYDIEITWDDVAKHAGDENLIARPHVAHAMVEKGYVPFKAMAFDLYIGNNGPAYVAKEEVPTQDVIRMIQDAGGFAVVAHPGKLRNQDYVYDFIKMGLDGIEVWHPDHSFLEIEKFKDIARKNGLYMTGGTDFHGDLEGKIKLSNANVGQEVLQSVLEMYEEYKCRNK